MNFKKIGATIASIGMAGLALAEEASGSSSGSADSIIENVCDTMEAFAGTALTAVGTIVAAFVVFYLVKVGIRVLKGAASASK